MGIKKNVDKVNIIKAELAELTEKVGELYGVIKEFREISKEMNSNLVHKQVPIIENCNDSIF